MKKRFLILTLYTLITQCTLHSQWVQQTLPVSGLVYDIAFLNANTGFVSMNTPALLKTTNGGTNWFVFGGQLIYHIQFLDTLYGYAHGYYAGNHKMYKTTNGGVSWDSMFVGQGAYGDISFISRDTGWIGGFDQASNTMIWKTTNGGQNFQLQYTAPGPAIGDIFFTRQSYGGNYYGWFTGSGLMARTTNSGVNWAYYSNLPNSNAGWIFFLNKDTGWVTNFNGSQNYTMYTTNNGINWTIQNLPATYGAGDLYFYNQYLGWGAGGFGKVVATTNSGFNWGTQDVPFFTVNSIFFLDSLTGWCGGNGIAKTTNGGGNITYQGIQPISNDIPINYKLYQNYPNPFNISSKIKIQIPKLSFVKLIVYDILGREVMALINEPLKPGTYEVSFDGSSLTSGTYFYRLIAGDASTPLSMTEARKMILLK
jgi:photosystem II stability/assembly factor-like uncharacterized protein